MISLETEKVFCVMFQLEEVIVRRFWPVNSILKSKLVGHGPMLVVFVAFLLVKSCND